LATHAAPAVSWATHAPVELQYLPEPDAQVLASKPFVTVAQAPVLVAHVVHVPLHVGVWYLQQFSLQL
jgi:hypothetical protein